MGRENLESDRSDLCVLEKQLELGLGSQTGQSNPDRSKKASHLRPCEYTPTTISAATITSACNSAIFANYLKKTLGVAPSFSANARAVKLAIPSSLIIVKLSNHSLFTKFNLGWHKTPFVQRLLRNTCCLKNITITKKNLSRKICKA